MTRVELALRSAVITHKHGLMSEVNFGQTFEKMFEASECCRELSLFSRKQKVEALEHGVQSVWRADVLTLYRVSKAPNLDLILTITLRIQTSFN